LLQNGIQHFESITNQSHFKVKNDVDEDSSLAVKG